MSGVKRTMVVPGVICWTFLFVLGCAASNAQAAPTRNIQKNRVTDQYITDAVEDEFLFDRGVPLNEVLVSTTDGVVELAGTVNDLLAKDRAERIAETVKGVRSVVNRIEVDPFWERADWQIERDAEEALLHDTATDSWEIQVEVENNVATLEGRVDSWQEKQLAAKVVKGVKGVKGIDNDITVEYDTERTDYEIKQDIAKALHWDILVDDALIDVKVDDGKVELSGTVGSAAEKHQAYWDAWVTGVKAVDQDGLVVKYWARNDRLRKDKYKVKPDGEIEQAVEDAMLYDPRVNSLKVQTDVDNGFVTLRGKVDSLEAKRAAAHDARNTVGVAGVTNRLRIDLSTPTSEEIENRVEESFLRDPYVERYEIGVEVIDGTAYLTGEVDTYYEKTRADDLAARVYGVTRVSNDIDVDQDTHPLIYDPYLYDYDPYAYQWYDYEPYYTPLDDAEIREEIEDEMWWSPYVDADEVKISVEDGVATLRGTVDTLFEEDKAVEEAYEGGATWVRNKLKVD